MSKTIQMAQSAYNQGLTDAAAGRIYKLRKARWQFKADYVRGVKAYIDRMSKSNPLDRETIVSRTETWPKEYYAYLIKNNPSLAGWRNHSIELLDHHNCTFIVDANETITEYTYNDIVQGKFPSMVIELWGGKAYLIAHDYYAMGGDDYDFTIKYAEATGGGFDEFDVVEDDDWSDENTFVDHLTPFGR